MREVKEEPPLLYDLTALQRDANTRLDFSADRTLSLAQSLYEKKVLSYPRTGSRYISEDVFDEIPSRIALLKSPRASPSCGNIRVSGSMPRRFPAHRSTAAAWTEGK